MHGNQLKRQAQNRECLESVRRLVPPDESVEGTILLTQEASWWLSIGVGGATGAIIQLYFGVGWLGWLVFGLVVGGIEFLGTGSWILGWTDTEFLLCRGAKWSGPKAVALEKRLPRGTPITRIEKPFGERVEMDGKRFLLSPEDSRKLRVELSLPKSTGFQ